MKYFSGYTSNTYAGSGNQHIFTPAKDAVHTGRIFYKITCPGKYNYSLLFSNITDSTFSDGSVSYRNLLCDPWCIWEAKAYKCSSSVCFQNFTVPDIADRINGQVTDPVVLTFDGNTVKQVAPGEFFCCDPFSMAFEAGDYLCLELTFSGTRIPYHEETLLPVFRKQDGHWVYEKRMPFAGMVGCARPVAARIGYLGDSITQGIGTVPNSYAHWNALLSQKLGPEYAYWNLGLGFGRASDMASDGAWMYKARHNDVAIVCYGVNDLLQGQSEAQIIQDLNIITERLLQANITVILQTIPPFNYSGETIEKWKRINRYILTELAQKAALVFDVVPYLSESSEQPYIAKYGGHPNEEGCARWAQALYERIAETGILP